MAKSIYLPSGILGTIAVFVVGCVSHVQTETAPITSPSSTASRTSSSLSPKPEFISPPTANSDTALASPHLGDYQISHRFHSA
ncbi:hypothetical protein [Aliterella atlantica]|uniref:hypothetical protein n=1 Tax=Aliterella atlantica TaxID=1827278 RepID=UPI0011847A46|nr:hypothetical protein [Aliterella atlantica]